jgi:murein L,D-transpeptidase YcbB/YkuD
MNPAIVLIPLGLGLLVAAAKRKTNDTGIQTATAPPDMVDAATKAKAHAEAHKAHAKAVQHSATRAAIASKAQAQAHARKALELKAAAKAAAKKALVAKQAMDKARAAQAAATKVANDPSTDIVTRQQAANAVGQYKTAGDQALAALQSAASEAKNYQDASDAHQAAAISHSTVADAQQKQAATATQQAQQADLAAQQAHSEQASQADRLRTAAQALDNYLRSCSSPDCFGYKGHPDAKVAAFQRIAKIPADGEVGPVTRAAAAKAGVTLPDVPPPIPVEVVPSAPVDSTAVAPSGYDPALAATLAPALESHLRVKKYDYSRPKLKEFQTAAGLKPDGVYGGGTRGALLYYGAKSPPRPLFAPTDTIPYTPPA